MASQAIIFAETIAGMKRAVKRKSYGKMQISSIEQLTNRGNKLRRRARFVHEGQLAPPTGPQVYKRRIEHAGYHREIISRNPPLIDDDGYEVDTEDDDDVDSAQARIAAAAAEFDPYAEVKIEHLLMPLTAAADLPDHPTLSKPFLSKTIPELTRHAGDMVKKERGSLWRIKHLLTRLSGDSTWIPCEIVEAENDIALFFDEHDKFRASLIGKSNSKDDADQTSTATLTSDDVQRTPSALTPSTKPAIDTADQTTGNTAADEEPPAISVNASAEGIHGHKDEPYPPTNTVESTEHDEHETKKSGTDTVLRKDASEGAEKAIDSEAGKGIADAAAVDQVQPSDEGVEMETEGGLEGQEDIPAPHRMRTRAQAQAASDNTASSRTRSITPDDTFIHPFFLAPKSSYPDRDVGLPPHEAEETRRLLQLYIQKQEEVCRGAQRIYEGLLRADRYRKLVMKWAKAEGHVGENRDMSDGEDWYDKEEWGLDGDLKKGQDEEEEDAATTAKKTRTRRQ
ncbi:Uncharacterized protein BP5553_01994 [Venustampulla echinocandica]|uniref:Transcriptional regulatory protein RXT2 N-terminal domain-containing protein n=1 Tax=Venustampulla echinocandica TaxID=2656787 RepID=A0A370U2N1_9HELO|nr:Uncharacterized protein BP5553_01994 [Venustampulla echinocandica]RDL42015.1 Uncharacterized protein BP5553_01994 [Venustampulla echinocandica]